MRTECDPSGRWKPKPSFSDSKFEYSLQFYAVGAIIELMQRRLRREMKTWGADRNFIWSSREIAQILGESDRLALKWILV
jgi:hypothetical protein